MKQTFVQTALPLGDLQAAEWSEAQCQPNPVKNSSKPPKFLSKPTQKQENPSPPRPRTETPSVLPHSGPSAVVISSETPKVHSETPKVPSKTHKTSVESAAETIKHLRQEGRIPDVVVEGSFTLSQATEAPSGTTLWNDLFVHERQGSENLGQGTQNATQGVEPLLCVGEEEGTPVHCPAEVWSPKRQDDGYNDSGPKALQAAQRNPISPTDRKFVWVDIHGENLYRQSADFTLTAIQNLNLGRYNDVPPPLLLALGHIKDDIVALVRVQMPPNMRKGSKISFIYEGCQVTATYNGRKHMKMSAGSPVAVFAVTQKPPKPHAGWASRMSQTFTAKSKPQGPDTDTALRRLSTE